MMNWIKLLLIAALLYQMLILQVMLNALYDYLVNEMNNSGSFCGSCSTWSMMVYCLPKMSGEVDT